MKKNQRIVVRATPTDKELLRRLSLCLDLPGGEIVRKLIMKEAKKVLRDPAPKSA